MHADKTLISILIATLAIPGIAYAHGDWRKSTQLQKVITWIPTTTEVVIVGRRTISRAFKPNSELD
jgi:hypothetical protein